MTNCSARYLHYEYFPESETEFLCRTTAVVLLWPQDYYKYTYIFFLYIFWCWVNVRLTSNSILYWWANPKKRASAPGAYIHDASLQSRVSTNRSVEPSAVAVISVNKYRYIWNERKNVRGVSDNIIPRCLLLYRARPRAAAGLYTRRFYYGGP